MSNKTSNKTDKKNYALGVLPLWMSKSSDTVFNSMSLDPNNSKYEDNLSKLQEMVKALAKGGKVRFKIISNQPNEEGNTKPNAWLEYYTPEQVKSFNSYQNNKSEGYKKKVSKKQDSEEDFL
jgi:hypothetical protein